MQEAERVECPSTINYGRVYHCILQNKSEFQQFAFSARQGDALIMRADGGTRYINIDYKVFDSSNKNICRGLGTSMLNDPCLIPLDGVYTLRASVSSTSEDAPFPYSFYLNSLNSALASALLEYGENTNLTLESLSKVDLQAFEGHANETIVINVTAQSRYVNLSVYVYDAQFRPVCSGLNMTLMDEGCVLQNDGIYVIAIYISSSLDEEPFPYTLFTNKV